MAKKAPDNKSAALDTLKNDISSSDPRRFYIFYGPERYLLEHYLGTLRTLLCPGGLNDFNYRRYEGKGLNVDELASACETLPVFAERTLVEIHDFDLFKMEETQREMLIELLSDLPEHVCLVFVYIGMDYAPDKRLKKLVSAIKSNAHVVEFAAPGANAACQMDQKALQGIRQNDRYADGGISGFHHGRPDDDAPY